MTWIRRFWTATRRALARAIDPGEPRGACNSQAPWSELLNDVVRFVRDVERAFSHGCEQPPSPLQVVVFSAVVQQRRVLEALSHIGLELGTESMALARIVFDVWSNVEWIHLEDSENRALDFSAILIRDEGREPERRRLAALRPLQLRAEAHHHQDGACCRGWRRREGLEVG